MNPDHSKPRHMSGEQTIQHTLGLHRLLWLNTAPSEKGRIGSAPGQAGGINPLKALQISLVFARGTAVGIPEVVVA